MISIEELTAERENKRNYFRYSNSKALEYGACDLYSIEC